MVVLHTGNLLRHIEPQKSNQEEFEKGLLYAQQNGLLNQIPIDERAVQESDSLRKCHKCIQTTIRLYLLPDATEYHIKEAIERTLNDLATKCLEHVHLDCNLKTSQNFLSLWRVLEDFVLQGSVKNIGVHDFTLNELTILLKNAKIKPYSNRIPFTLNLDKEMQAFCKEHEIKLISAPKEGIKLVTSQTEPILKEYSHLNNHWIVRYVISLQCQSLILNRGYLIQFE